MFQLVCSHLCFVFVQKSCLKNVIHFLCNQFKSSQPKLCSWKYLIYLFICCCFVQLNWIYYVLLLLLHRPSYLVSFAKWNQVPFLYVFDCAQANLFYCIHLNTFDSAFFYIYIYISVILCSHLCCFLCFCFSEEEPAPAVERVSSGLLGYHPSGLPSLLDGQQTSKLLQLGQPCSRLSLFPD